jgi:serine/threonine protein kinase
MSTVIDTFVNKRIGRYEIRERIGVGGMARVYKAWDSNLDRTVAVKILHEHLAADATFKERFEREAKFIASLNHPNIVQVYDFSMTNEGGQMISYMVMPFIAGKNLREILEEACARGERLTHDRIRDILLDVSAALNYAHTRGMVHRDVKPANILFDEHDHAVLSDFGIARLAEGAQLTQEGATVGTPTYISPEQASGLPVDARSDIYALGVMLYEMLAGEPPFTADTNLSLILKHINEPVPSISQHLSVNNPALDALVYKAMAKNENDRHQTVQAFADDLVSVFGGSSGMVSKTSDSGKFESTKPLIATMPGATTVVLDTPVQQPGMMRSPLAIGAFVLAIGSLLAVIVLFAQRPTETQPTPEPTTQISSMTGEEAFFISSFDADDPTLAGWPQVDNASVIRQVTPEGFYRFYSDLMSSAITSIYNPMYEYEDGTIIVEGTLDETSDPNSAYGIVFRFEDERNYNVFAVDGLGRYSIWELRDANWRELRGLENERWTTSEFVNEQGESNQLVVAYYGDRLVAGVNSQPLVDLTIESIPSGKNVGLYLATYKSGTATALIDTYQVSADIPSMTGNN